MATFKLNDDHDIEEDIEFPSHGPGYKASAVSSKDKNGAGHKGRTGYSFNSQAGEARSSSPGYKISEPKYDSKAGFKIADENKGKSPSKLRKNWWKALLLAPLAWYVAEGVYYTSQTDHPDEYAFSGVPGYVVEEIGYDLEDAYHYVHGLIGEEKAAPQIPPGMNYAPQWMVEDELQVLFLRPRYVDDDFNEVAPRLDINAFFQAQQQYVMDAIQEGYKGTKMGNAAAHGEYMTIALVSPADITKRMSFSERRELSEMSPDDQLNEFMRRAHSQLERVQTREFSEQRNPARHNYSATYKPAY